MGDNILFNDLLESSIISIRNLTKIYADGKRKIKALDGLNFFVNKEEIYGLLGPNGAGKTTAIRIILGIIDFKVGEVVTCGYFMPKKREKLANIVGYMPQTGGIYNDLTVVENLRFFGLIYGLNGDILGERIEEVLKFFRIEDFKDTLAVNLSGGTRRRLSLMCALIHKPKLLVLDEPTQGVDPVLRETFWDYFRYLAQTEGTTILITTHYLDEAVRCDRIGFLRQGSLILEGRPREMLEKYGKNSIEEVFLTVAKGLDEGRMEFERAQ